MKTITMDCAGVEEPRQLHRLLATALELPDWYGHNLDALFDCLTELPGPVVLRLENWNTLGGWRSGFGGVFADAGLENPELDVVLC